MSAGGESRGGTVEIRGVSKMYEHVTAVNDVSLEIHPGEFVTFLGPSGSGKTTLLNLIAGFLPLTDGDIRLNGESLLTVPAYRRNLGMVFQSYALFPHMNVFDNVAFPLRRRSMQKDQVNTHVSEMLDMVGLEGYSGRYPTQLSGGQQQRVALARALVFEPPVMLMDEPLGALDRRLRENLQLEIRRLHQELGYTFIFVTHDQDEALTLSDRIAVFNDGVIEQVGTPEAVYGSPSSEFIARFLGESNMIRGVFDRNLGAIRVGDRLYYVDANGGDDSGVGREVTAIVRPEKIRVKRSGSPRTGENQVRGRLVDKLFLGAAVRLVIQGDDGKTYVARCLAEDSGPELYHDDTLTLEWKREDTRVVGV